MRVQLAPRSDQLGTFFGTVYIQARVMTWKELGPVPLYFSSHSHLLSTPLFSSHFDFGLAVAKRRLVMIMMTNQKTSALIAVTQPPPWFKRRRFPQLRWGWQWRWVPVMVHDTPNPSIPLDMLAMMTTVLHVLVNCPQLAGEPRQ